MWYSAPIGCIGNRFVKRLMAELKELRTIEWNYDCPLVCFGVILLMTDNVQSSKNIFMHIQQQMDL